MFGKKIISSVISAVTSAIVLCGSVIGGISDVSAAKVAIPQDDEKSAVKTVEKNAEKNVDTSCAAAYAAYIELLKSEQEYIDSYTWQASDDKQKHVALADVYGNDLPELIFMKAVDDGCGRYDTIADLEIYTWSHDEVILLASLEHWDVAAGAGVSYRLFQMDGQKELCLYRGSSNGKLGDNGKIFDVYDCLVDDGSGKLVKKEICQKVVTGSDTTPKSEFTSGGKATTEEVYTSTVAKIEKSTTAVLLFSTRFDNSSFTTDYIRLHGCSAMTCSEAIVFLQTKIGQPFTLEPEEVPESLTQFFYWLNFGFGWCNGYDCEKPVSEYYDGRLDELSPSDSPFTLDNILFRIMTNASCCNESLYPGIEKVNHYIDKTSDPKNKYSGSYTVFDLGKAKWIAKYILNQSDSNIDFFLKQGEKNEYFYIQDGKVYLSFGGVGDTRHIITYLSVAFDGYKFNVQYSDRAIHELPSDAVYYEASVDYKEVDGCAYWSLYQLSSSGKTPISSNVSQMNTNEVKTIQVGFNDKTVDLNWGWELFNKDATEYDHNIAMAGLILSQAAENGQDIITSRLARLGFDNYQSHFYETYDFWDLVQGCPAVTFASRKIVLDGKEKVLIAIVVRGTSDAGDWLTDLKAIPTGFLLATANTQKLFLEFYDKLPALYDMTITPQNTIFFITGHSLGGAVAGELGVSLEGEYGESDGIFDYTFASPNYLTPDNKEHDNIHNIINKGDIVPTVPWGFSKYGHLWYYELNDEELVPYFDKTLSAEDKKHNALLFNHICSTYMMFMMKGVPTNVGPGATTTYSLSSIHCPVDVQVLDESGNRLAWTVGDQVYYAEEPNFIILMDGDEKYVYVPEGINYNLLFTGTDTGTMTYTQQVISAGEVVSEKSFEDVAIETDKLLYSSVNAKDASAQTVYVIDDDGRIQENVKQTGKETSLFLPRSKIGWVFVVVDVVSALFLLISILSLFKKKRKNNA